MAYDDLGSLPRRENRALSVAASLVRAALEHPGSVHEAMGAHLAPLALGTPEETWDNVTEVLAVSSVLLSVLLLDVEEQLGVAPEVWLSQFDELGPAGVLRSV